MTELQNIKPALIKVRRSLAEIVGIAKYSRPSLNGLDFKLEKYLDFDNGFFIEAGANDGFSQSNTYYFEKIRKWSGILVEPVPKLFAQCRKVRKRSLTFNAALVGEDFEGDTITINYANLMSTVEGSLGSAEAMQKHLQEAQAFLKDPKEIRRMEVPARTLTSILDEAAADRVIDLLSLDVEGYEIQALKGLNIDRYRPRFICLEVRDEPAINTILNSYYEIVEILDENIAYKNILYIRRDVLGER